MLLKTLFALSPTLGWCRQVAGDPLMILLLLAVLAAPGLAAERSDAHVSPGQAADNPASRLDWRTTPVRVQRPLPPGSSTTIAYGIDGVPDPVQLSRLVLGRPEVIQYVGSVELPNGRILSACDFQGNDFSTLYCLDTENFGPDDTTNLYTVDTKTAEMTYLAGFTLTGAAPEGLNGLTYDPTTGKMFAVTCYPVFEEDDSLYELDLEALTLTQIGESTQGLCLQALAADNGGQLWGLDIHANGLYSINKETGEMTFVGPFGFNVGFGQGMDFNASNNSCNLFIYNVDTDRGELHHCDTVTGETKFEGVLGEEYPGAGQLITAAIAVPSDCHVTLELSAQEVHAGDPLRVRVSIIHNRAKTVSVPLGLAIQDASGQVVVSRHAKRTMKVGDRLDRELLVHIPRGLPPGSYMVTLSVGEMEQGDVRLSKMLKVVESSN